LFGVVVLGYVVIRPLLSGGSVAGFPFLASTIAIFSGVQLFALGIIGEYLARMHFRIAKKPTYVVLETAGGAQLSDSASPTIQQGSA
jgi:undecaprenyl-phosphate 4-deoxy-4-formamido-L-arabinose transferase